MLTFKNLFNIARLFILLILPAHILVKLYLEVCPLHYNFKFIDIVTLPILFFFIFLIYFSIHTRSFSCHKILYAFDHFFLGLAQLEVS